MAMHTLEQLLIENRVLSAVQLAVARRDAEVRRQRLAPTLVELGLIDEDRLARWIAEISGLRLLDSLPVETAAALAGRVPARLARIHGLVPLAVNGDELIVATCDPFDQGGLDQLHITTGMKIRAVVARAGEMTRAIDRLYPFDFGSETLMAGDDSLGSSTQILTPRPNLEPASQLDRIEAQLAALTALVEALERKVASIDATLVRVLPR